MDRTSDFPLTEIPSVDYEVRIQTISTQVSTLHIYMRRAKKNPFESAAKSFWGLHYSKNLHGFFNNLLAHLKVENKRKSNELGELKRNTYKLLWDFHSIRNLISEFKVYLFKWKEAEQIVEWCVFWLIWNLIIYFKRFALTYNFYEHQ